MSTVLPDEPLDEPPLAPLLLPLLLQPAAARATAARAAAIAGVRFNTFMIFLSFNWPARRPGAHRPTRSGPHRGATADPAPCHRERVGRSSFPTRPTPGRAPYICPAWILTYASLPISSRSTRIQDRKSTRLNSS